MNYADTVVIVGLHARGVSEQTGLVHLLGEDQTPSILGKRSRTMSDSTGPLRGGPDNLSVVSALTLEFAQSSVTATG